ncbi:MAG: hypothetical protein HYY43_02625 [Deltaproteobacteria bacterium]|nr:hypothetical protein [Deltaproteobacteria bacterium]MBI2974468.1 hypothetical protein [Deltaproteobacteria bacterium]
MPIPTNLNVHGQKSPNVAESPTFENHVIEFDSESEVKAQIQRLGHGQIAILTFSASWCSPCHEYKPYLDKFARETKGLYLLLRTENEDLATKNRVPGYPFVVAIKREGTYFELYEIENRNNLLNEITAIAAGARKPMGGKRQIGTRQIWEPSVGVASGKTEAPQLTPADIEADVAKYRTLILKSTGEARISSVPSYLSAVRKLDKAKMLAEIRDWSETFKGCMDSSCERAIDDLYAGARNFWMKDRVIDRNELSPILREDFNSSNPFIRYGALADYRFMADGLNSSEAHQVASSLRLMFADGNDAVRLEAVKVYDALTKYQKITKTSELADGASALRRLLLDPKPAILEQAASTYASILEKLSPKEAAEELKSLCRMNLTGVEQGALSRLRYVASSVIGKYKLKLSCRM